MMDGYRPVTRRSPCPICGKPDWCIVAKDGTHAICPRTVSSRPLGEAGYRHDLTDRPARKAYFPSKPKRAPEPEAPTLDCDLVQKQLVANADEDWLLKSSVQLGLKFSAMMRLHPGRTEKGDMTFPMRDGEAKIIGFRVRSANGRKYAITGSKSGLFIPDFIGDPGTVFITEGPTDTGAMLTLGFNAVGRPSCTGGTRHLLQLVKMLRLTPIIVSDNDGPGVNGSRRLPGLLGATKIIFPPWKHKDIRTWVINGATAADVQLRVDNTAYHLEPA
ncbi:MAG: hypothetical protein AAGK78_14565 [Planctomycetota bacterium]